MKKKMHNQKIQQGGNKLVYSLIAGAAQANIFWEALQGLVEPCGIVLNLVTHVIALEGLALYQNYWGASVSLAPSVLPPLNRYSNFSFVFNKILCDCAYNIDAT